MCNPVKVQNGSKYQGQEYIYINSINMNEKHLTLIIIGDVNQTLLTFWDASAYS